VVLAPCRGPYLLTWFSSDEITEVGAIRPVDGALGVLCSALLAADCFGGNEGG
jgi:hypothetical protein